MFDIVADDFVHWRDAARQLLGQRVPPAEIAWRESTQAASMFADTFIESTKPAAFTVPPKFVDMARLVACWRGPEKWPLLYSLLWRLKHGEKHLLELPTDPQVHQLLMMEKAVRRDRHKMTAFVRFRQLIDKDEEWYIAWYQPDHRILELTTPFFQKRFTAMNWAILTPDGSAYWDRDELRFGPPMPRQSAPAGDELEDAWKTYYRAIFNPARIKLKAMKKEMPTRFWHTLPETEIIGDLLREAPQRVEAMVAHQEGSAMSARNFIPERRTLETLREAAACCQGCDLYKHATQTVFGEGPAAARLMLVGEQPGDQEDRQGHPFVGPAGQLLDQALTDAGIDRDDAYITNTVKHFSFTESGPRRLHKKPTARQTSACVPWLEAEIEAVKPQGIVCLGATAAQALISKEFRITRQRGQMLDSERADWILATWHPSALLRAPDAAARNRMTDELIADLRLAAARLR